MGNSPSKPPPGKPTFSNKKPSESYLLQYSIEEFTNHKNNNESLRDVLILIIISVFFIIMLYNITQLLFHQNTKLYHYNYG
jgi:uncharacterized ion transporter superfamily protein YfcC